MSTLSDILNSGYKYRVTFCKTFKSGLLNGKTVDNQILRFVSWYEADNFAKSCDDKTIFTSCTSDSTFTKSNAILEAI